MSTVKNALNSQVSVQKTKLWSDSMTALYWIMNQGEWKQFVSHRVNEIVKLSKKEDWGHCPSEQNPADTGSRGSLAVELKGNEMWWHGPSWLIQPEDLWPRQKSLVPTIETCEEERKVAVMTIAVNEPCGIERVVEINKYSTLRKLYRVTAWVTRFCHNISRRNKSDKREGALTLEEIVESEELWIRMAQRELRKGENYQQLVSKFGLQEDQKGVIRCKGRLEYSEMVHETKEPIILPKEQRLTILQIQECHHKVLHNGVRSTLAELRSRFWVPKGRQLVKRVISRCVLCKKTEGRPFTQPPTPSLPEFRVRPAPPFSKVGVDFAGPLFVEKKVHK